MNLHSQIIDDFLPGFDVWRGMADRVEYRDVVSPTDGVTYPGIVDLSGLKMDFAGLLADVMGRPVTVNHLFLRLSLAGSKPPHWAHHDGLMGQYSLMVYLNRPEHCAGGTALLEHADEWCDGPPDDATWLRDTNDPDMWRIVSRCPMVTNRAFIFRANLWHAALPLGGFGSGPEDGRLVLTAFFE